MKSGQSKPIDITTGAKIEDCAHAGAAEACKEAFIEHSSEGIEAGIKASVSAFKKEAETKTDSGIEVGAKVEFGHAESDASFKFDAKEMRIKLGAGIFLAKATGKAKLELFCDEKACYEFSVVATTGIGASASMGVGAKKTSKTSAYSAGLGLGPVKSEFMLIITDKKSGATKEAKLPPELSDLIKKSNGINQADLDKNADKWFTNYLKKQNKKEMTEDARRQFAKEETEKFMKGEGEVFEYLTKQEKVIAEATDSLSSTSPSPETIMKFNEVGHGCQEVAAILHLGGNQHAVKLATFGSVVSSLPQVTSAVKQSFGVIGGLFSGGIGLSMGSALSVVSGLGAIATIGTALQSIFGRSGGKKDKLMEFLGRMDQKLDTIINNQAIMNTKLDILNVKADKIYDTVNQIFFTQQLNQKEIVALLTDHFSRVHSQLSDTHTLLGNSYALITEESAELRGMLQEGRYAVIQELRGIVKSKMKRSITTFEQFLESEFDTLYNKAKVANAGSTLTTGVISCDTENTRSLLAHFKDLRTFKGMEDFYSVFNTINLVQECLAYPGRDGGALISDTEMTKLKNLVGIHIQLDTLLQIVNHLQENGRDVRKLLPEIEDHIKEAQQDINNIEEFFNTLLKDQVDSKLLKQAKEALIERQQLVKMEKDRFEEKINKKIDEQFAPLLIAEKAALENELNHFGELHYPYVWQKPYNSQELQKFMKLNHGGVVQELLNYAANNHRWDVIRTGWLPVAYNGKHRVIRMLSLNWLKNFKPELHKAIETQNGLTYPVNYWKNDDIKANCNNYGCPDLDTYDWWRRNNPGVAKNIAKLGFENHNEGLYQQLVALSNTDFQAKLREQIHHSHNASLESYQANTVDQHASFSLAIDGETLKEKNTPILQLMLPSEKFNSGKGPALLLPSWLDWKKVFPEWLKAEQFGFGKNQYYFKSEGNNFVAEFQFKTNQGKVYELGDFKQNLDDVICNQPVSYSEVEKAYYYWNGGIYCYTPSIEKIAYVGLSGSTQHLNTNRFSIHTLDYPKFDVFPGHWNKSEVSVGFKKSDKYDQYVAEMNASGDELLKKLRKEFNAEIRNAIVQQQPIGAVTTKFEMKIRLLHDNLLKTASDPFVARDIHEKLLKIVKACDQKGTLDFIDKYQGSAEYLQTHDQECVDALNKLELDLKDMPKTSGYFLAQTQEKALTLADKVKSENVIENSNPITEQTLSNGAYSAASHSFVINSIKFARNFAKSSLSATFSGAKMLGSTAAHYAGKLWGTAEPIPASVSIFSDNTAESFGSSEQQNKTERPGYIPETKSEAIDVLLKEFRVKPSQPNPLDASPASFSDNLMLLQCALPLITPHLPWCKAHALTPEDKEYMKLQQNILIDHEVNFPKKQSDRAQKLGVLSHEFADLKSLIASTKTLISAALKHNAISSSDKSRIVDNMNKIDELKAKIFKYSYYIRQDSRYANIAEKRKIKKEQKRVRQIGFFSEARKVPASFVVAELPLSLPQSQQKQIQMPAYTRKLVR